MQLSSRKRERVTTHTDHCCSAKYLSFSLSCISTRHIRITNIMENVHTTQRERNRNPPRVHIQLSLSMVQRSMCIYNCGKRAVQLGTPVSFLPHLYIQLSPPRSVAARPRSWTATGIDVLSGAFAKLTMMYGKSVIV